MTKLTAVDWGRGIEENQVPAHKLIPALPYHRSDRTREPRTDTEGGGWGMLMSHSAELSAPPSLLYEKITNENPIDRCSFPFRQIACFLYHSVV